MKKCLIWNQFYLQCTIIIYIQTPEGAWNLLRVMVFVWWRNFGHLGISPRIPSRRNGDLAHMHSKLIPSAPNIYQINHFTAHCTQTKKYYLHIISRKPILLHIWTRRSMTNGWTIYMYIVVQYYLVAIQY